MLPPAMCMRYTRSEVFLGFNNTVVENVELGKTLDLESSFKKSLDLQLSFKLKNWSGKNQGEV